MSTAASILMPYTLSLGAGLTSAASSLLGNYGAANHGVPPMGAPKNLPQIQVDKRKAVRDYMHSSHVSSTRSSSNTSGTSEHQRSMTAAAAEANAQSSGSVPSRSVSRVVQEHQQRLHCGPALSVSSSASSSPLASPRLSPSPSFVTSPSTLAFEPSGNMHINALGHPYSAPHFVAVQRSRSDVCARAIGAAFSSSALHAPKDDPAPTDVVAPPKRRRAKSRSYSSPALFFPDHADYHFTFGRVD